MFVQGKLIASAQAGDSPDVVVWDFESRSMRYRFEEHSHGVVAVAFSHDDVRVTRIHACVHVRLEAPVSFWACYLTTGVFMKLCLTLLAIISLFWFGTTSRGRCVPASKEDLLAWSCRCSRTALP